MGKKNFVLASESGSSVSDLANVTGVAYSGGPVSQWWSDLKLVIDLTGLNISPQIPLLYNHQNDPEYRLGEIEAIIENGQITITGGVDKGTERGKFIADAGKKFNWQLSIGAEIVAMEEVSAEDTRVINGREFSGPFYHVKKSQLREVSVCAVGADPETTLQIAASLNMKVNPKNKGVETMNKEFQKYIQLKYKLGEASEEVIKAHLDKIGSTIEAEEKEFKASLASSNPVAGMTEEQISAIVAKQIAAREQADSERRAGIIAACGDTYADFAKEAIAAGYSVVETTRIVAALKAQASKVPASGPNIIVSHNPEVNAQVLEAALCFNQGVDEKTITASYSPQVVEAGNKYRGITLKELIRVCASLEGRNVPPTFNNETITAGYSTVSLPGILGNVAGKVALQSFQAQPTIAPRLCRAGDLADFKESERYRMTDVGDLEQISNGGELKNGGMKEDKATNKLETYGKIFTITRQMIYNDDLGAFLTIPKAMGQRAARKIDQLFHARLLANPTFTDNKALFHADHNNYLAGSDSALSLTSLKAAYTKFLNAKDSDGMPICVVPKYLFVPTELDAFARELAFPGNVVGGTTVTPAHSAVAHLNLEVISSPYLNSPAFKNNSSTGWYLFGDPEQIDTFEIGYLQGRRVPTIEHGETNFNTLGMSFRVVFDLGIREQAYQGMVFNKGVN